MTEVRITSETGGQKGSKPEQISTIDPLALLKLAEVSGFGAQKYAAYNYLKGYDWSLSYNAAQRHLMQFWNGEDTDDESGLLHVLHAGWHCLAMASFILRGLGTDDRYKQEGEEKGEPEAEWPEPVMGTNVFLAPQTFTLEMQDVDPDTIKLLFGGIPEVDRPVVLEVPKREIPPRTLIMEDHVHTLMHGVEKCRKRRNGPRCETAYHDDIGDATP